MEQEVSDDHILLTAVLEDHEITVKRLASGVGRAKPTVYRYCCGDATIPSIVWRWLFSETRDVRIANLITGEVPVVIVDLLPIKAAVDAATLEALLKTRLKSLEFEKRIVSILADGRIDDLDGRDIEKLRKEFPEMINAMAQIYQAVIGKYEVTKGVSHGS